MVLRSHGAASTKRERSNPELWVLEMLSERLVDDLCDGQGVEVSLAPDGCDPAALDVASR